MADQLEPNTISDSNTSSVNAPDFGTLLSQHYTPAETTESPVEEALELHEDIDLQAFIERKEWIEEKIKFLGTLPPVEVFMGLDAVRSSAEHVPGLPTRAELAQMEAEHDLIEKETEIFDSGELKKLRKFTKAATQRNLSPEDTDLIELTLTTIYELDKLLHLLRDRSDNLDLLAIRLSWEEKRISSWETRRTIMNDMTDFLNKRARWSTATYEYAMTATNVNEQQPPTRRGSVASVASVASDTASPVFSRSARFKLVEMLARDAAQFASKLSTLRHGKVLAAGKILDKLVDNSRKPVPDELLDEQDKLEAECIASFEQVSGFLMDVVMQWKKADEVYIETIKDQGAAQALVDEIQTACTQHPTARQSSAYVSRADTLSRRLAVRGSPLASTTAFPRPEHSLFPDQQSINEALTADLLMDISAATSLTATASNLAKEYRSSYEAVKRVESLRESLNALSEHYASILDRFEHGVPSRDGDGSPPDLTSEVCVEGTRHATFLKTLPNLRTEHDSADETCAHLLRQSHGALLGIDFPGVDPELKLSAVSAVQRLTSLRDITKKAREGVSSRVDQLRIVRAIWNSMDESLKQLVEIRHHLREATDRERWRQQAGRAGAPPTPESPTITLPSPSSSKNVQPAAVLKHIDTIHDRLKEVAGMPLENISSSLETPLKTWLLDSYRGISSFSDSVRQAAHLLDAIENQARIMYKVRDEFGELQLQIEDAKLQLDSNIRDIFATNVNDTPSETEESVQARIDEIQKEVADFLGALLNRVPFVAQRGVVPRSKTVPTSTDIVLGKLNPGDDHIQLPFELTSVDDAVRADSNSYAMRISGDLKALEQKANHFTLAIMAKAVDAAVLATTDDVHRVSAELNAQKQDMLNMLPCDADAIDTFSADAENTFRAHRSRIARSFSPIRELLRQMDAAPGSHDTAVHEVVYLSRIRAVDDAELKFNSWDAETASFRVQIAEIRQTEMTRVEQERVARELEVQIEKNKREAAEADRVRQEAEAQEQERLRVQEEWMAKEKAWQEEKDRAAAEAEERSRLDLEQKEKDRIALERLQEERRLHEEQARQAAAEVERMRVQAEQVAHAEEERLRSEAELKAEETRLRLETERKAEEIRLRLEAERVAEENRLRLDAERVAEEIRVGLESQRVVEVTRLRLEAERTAEETRMRIGAERRQAKEDEERQREDEFSLGDPFRLKVGSSSKILLDGEDVFGTRVVLSEPTEPQSKETVELQSRIVLLRKRLLSLNLSEIARPTAMSSASNRLPTAESASKMNDELSSISKDIDELPETSSDSNVDTQLRSLRTEMEASRYLMAHLHKLTSFNTALILCDAALSDLIEHTDSYPASPTGQLLSPYAGSLTMSPEDQLSARLTFTQGTVHDMEKEFKTLAQDKRAQAEHKRVLQTWSELKDISNDLISGRRSRSASVVSSIGGQSSEYNSNASFNYLPATKRKSNAYPMLSVASSSTSSSRGRLHLPKHPATARRAVSGNEAPTRPKSQISQPMASNRSVSGPLGHTIYGSTYSSRQRTTSLSSPGINTPVKRPVATPIRARAQTSGTRPISSPSLDVTRSHSRGDSYHPTSSMSSTWARTPRHSISTSSTSGANNNNTSTPNTGSPRVQRKPHATTRKAYVPNPKNKLDVAVGDVLNKLPGNMNIMVEVAMAETWKDQSGKYWIGDQDPKLCFCRILRSQTVMVRVGGGWTELSKFIQGHFADSFRLLPESPQVHRPSQEEKWISSATLLDPLSETSPPHNNNNAHAPRTPENRSSALPSMSVSSPSSHGSPRSMHSTPSKGGGSPLAHGGGVPLTPLQFMRRAGSGASPGMGISAILETSPPGVGMLMRPSTPSKVSSSSSASSILRPPRQSLTGNTPVRQSIWRP